MLGHHSKSSDKDAKKHQILVFSQVHIVLNFVNPFTRAPSPISSVGSWTLHLAPTLFQTFLRPWHVCIVIDTCRCKTETQTPAATHLLSSDVLPLLVPTSRRLWGLGVRALSGPGVGGGRPERRLRGAAPISVGDAQLPAPYRRPPHHLRSADAAANGNWDRPYIAAARPQDGIVLLSLAQ